MAENAEERASNGDNYNDLLSLVRHIQVELAETKALAAALSEKSDAQQRSIWRGLAGEHYEEFIRDPEHASIGLSNPNPRVRRAAITIIAEYWKPTASFAALCERFAFRDPDEHVRSTALGGMCAYYAGTGDARVKRMLADIIRDTTASVDYRAVAYISLRRVAGIPPDCLFTIALAQKRLDFGRDVDWEFVTACRAEINITEHGSGV